jgi:hypothetical protein
MNRRQAGAAQSRTKRRNLAQVDRPSPVRGRVFRSEHGLLGADAMQRHLLASFLPATLLVAMACGGRSLATSTGSGPSSSGGMGSSGSMDPGDCNGAAFTFCGSDGRLGTGCCPAGAHCAPPEPYCDRGSGRCELQPPGPSAGCGEVGMIVDAGPTACGTATCAAGDICVVTESGGGPCLSPDDAGLCPDGKPPTGGCCNREVTDYACAPLPGACGGTLSCACAASLCTCGGCGVPNDVGNTLHCVCVVP